MMKQNDYYEIRKEIRKEKSASILDKFIKYVKEELPDALPKSPLGKALAYTEKLLPSFKLIGPMSIHWTQKSEQNYAAFNASSSFCCGGHVINATVNPRSVIPRFNIFKDSFISLIEILIDGSMYFFIF